MNNTSSASTNSPPSTNSLRYELRVAIMVAIICFIVPFGMDGFVPSLPAMTQAFHSTANIMQLTITVSLLGGIISQLICGPLSDRIGRRKVVLVGVSIGLIGSLLCATAISPLWIILARFVQGLGIGSVNALFRAIMRDTFSGVRMAKFASYISMLYLAAVAAAPVLGGYLQTYFGWRGNFVFFILLSAAIILFAWLFLPETNKHFDPAAIRLRIIVRNYSTLLSSRIFLSNVLCSSLALSGIIAYFAISPFLLQNIVGLTPIHYGWSCMLLALGLMLGSTLNGSLVTRMGMQNMMCLGTTLMSVSGIIMLAIGLTGIMNVYVITGPALLFAIASGFVYTNAMSGAFQPFSHIAGATGAVYGAMQVLGAFLTSLLVTNLHVHNQIPLAGLLMVLGGIGVVIFYFLIRGKQQ